MKKLIAIVKPKKGETKEEFKKRVAKITKDKGINLNEKAKQTRTS